MPERFFKLCTEGEAAGKMLPLREMLDGCYGVKDWPNGVPSEAKLKGIKLGFSP